MTPPFKRADGGAHSWRPLPDGVISSSHVRYAPASGGQRKCREPAHHGRVGAGEEKVVRTPGRAAIVECVYHLFTRRKSHSLGE